MMQFSNGQETETHEQDMHVCGIVNSILQRWYPNHPWMIGVDHTAGTIVIDLMYTKPHKFRNYACLMHLSSLAESDNVKKIVRFGGEMLERFDLPRDGASPDARMRLLTGLNTFNGGNPDVS